MRALTLLGAAALLACGVKAPPRPPERAGVAGSRHDLRPAGADGGAAGEAGAGAGARAGEAGTDGGAGRP